MGSDLDPVVPGWLLVALDELWVGAESALLMGVWGRVAVVMITANPTATKRKITAIICAV